MESLHTKPALSRKTALLGGLAAGLLLFAAVLLFWASGDSGPSVSGTIRLDGEPLPTGSIKFIPQPGTRGPDAGAVIEEGKYRIQKGLTAGEYRVEIQATHRIAKKVRDPADPARLVQDEVAIVPPEYNRNSTLTCTVSAGANSIDFKLEGFKGKRTKAGKER